MRKPSLIPSSAELRSAIERLTRSRDGRRFVSLAKVAKDLGTTPHRCVAQTRHDFPGLLGAGTELRGLYEYGKKYCVHEVLPYSPPTLESVPVGWEAREVSTSIDEAGEPGEQWIRARPSAPRAELAPVIPEGSSAREVSTYVSGNGAILGQWIKAKPDHESAEDALRRLLRELPTEIPIRVGSIPLECERSTLDPNRLAVYPLGDPHVGLMTWEPETGSNWDLKIACAVFKEAIEELVNDPRYTKTQRALLLNLGDYFHADDASNRTPRGQNRLDVDGRYAKVMSVGIDLAVYMIDALLRAHEHVDVWNMQGNHDPTAALVLSLALKHHYQNEPRVNIEWEPKAYRYMLFGEVLIGSTHGDRVKLTELASIMAADRPVDWGASKVREWLVGHFHHKHKITEKELRGCKVESFRTLAPGDAWHVDSGYRAQRDLHRIVYHKRWGEDERGIISAARIEGQLRAKGLIE